MLADMIQRLGKGPFYSYGAALSGTGAVGLNLLCLLPLLQMDLSRARNQTRRRTSSACPKYGSRKIRVKLRSDVPLPSGPERAIKGMFLLHCCFTVMQDCDEAPLLPDI